MGSSTNCPKCGAAIERTGVSVVSELPIAIYACGTRQLDAKDSAPLQSDKCRITALQQQLADARLLARAAFAGCIVETADGQFELKRYKNNNIVYYTPLDFDEHGLPILTDEVRAALRKKIGDT